MKCCRAGGAYFSDTEMQQDIGSCLIIVKMIIKYVKRFRVLYFEFVPENYVERRPGIFEEGPTNSLV